MRFFILEPQPNLSRTTIMLEK